MSDDLLKLTPNESLRIVRSDAAALDVEATYGANGSPPPKHFHPAQDEHFEVLEGALRVRVDDDERELRAGASIDIPRGAVHQMWNPGDAPARVSWRTSPAGRTEAWFRAIDALYRERRVGRNGMPGPLAFGVILTEYRDVFRLAVRPEAPVRAALAVLGGIGRLRGYSPQAPS
jgi:quercetin dioxygenase-like cupin family protein